MVWNLHRDIPFVTDMLGTGLTKTYNYPNANKRSWKNHLNGVAGRGMSDALWYNANGALTARTTNDTSATDMAHQRIESYAYNALGLIEQYTTKSQQAKVSIDEDCALSAAAAPLSEWRYRFSPMAEREQKREYERNGYTDVLAWTYYMLGADAKQLSTWNGLEGDHCGETNTVWLWPVERNGYGPGNTRIIIRQDGSREYVVADHLGSTRAILNSAKERLEEHDYEPFGRTLAHDGTGARTSYIGREVDTESDLSMHGVRQYSQEYGRFMSADERWAKYSNVAPYQYAGNSPLIAFDWDGYHVSFLIQMGVRGSSLVVGHISTRVDDHVYSSQGDGRPGAELGLQTKKYDYDEYLEEQSPRGVIEITVLNVDEAAILRYLKGSLGHHGKYNLRTNSCVKTVLGALKAGGVPLRSPNGIVAPLEVLFGVNSSKYGGKVEYHNRPLAENRIWYYFDYLRTIQANGYRRNTVDLIIDESTEDKDEETQKEQSVIGSP